LATDVKRSSAEKRHRQSLVRRSRNKAVRSEVRGKVKKFMTTTQAKDKEKTQAAFLDMIKLLDGALKKGIYHRNTVARKKSRMQKLLNKVIAE